MFPSPFKEELNEVTISKRVFEDSCLISELLSKVSKGITAFSAFLRKGIDKIPNFSIIVFKTSIAPA